VQLRGRILEHHGPRLPPQSSETEFQHFDIDRSVAESAILVLVPPGGKRYRENQGEFGFADPACELTHIKAIYSSASVYGATRTRTIQLKFARRQR
jgi:hypothetical protein